MRYFTLLLIFISFCSIAEPSQKPVKKDSIAASIERIKYQLKIYKRSNDSLAVELSHYSQREDKYIALFDRYGGHADAILAIVVAIAAITPIAAISTYYKTKTQLMSVRKLTEDTLQSLERAKKALSQIHHNLAASIFYSYRDGGPITNRLNLLYTCLRHLVESSEFGRTDEQRRQKFIHMVLSKLETVLDNISEGLINGEGDMPLTPLSDWEFMEDTHAKIMKIVKGENGALSATCYAKALRLLEEARKRELENPI